jgi:hypothetical protein
MSPECVYVCEVLAQNTPQITCYSMLKLPLLGGEQKRAVFFVCVPLNANELLLPFKKWAELQELMLRWCQDALKMSETASSVQFEPESENNAYRARE